MAYCFLVAIIIQTFALKKTEISTVKHLSDAIENVTTLDCLITKECKVGMCNVN